MKKLLTSIALSVISLSKLSAQAPQFYAELGGPSVAGINFDTRFSKKDNGLGGRVGFGGIAIEGDGVLFFPVGINYLLGKPQSNNFFEVGINLTYVSALENGQEADPNNNLADTWGSLTLGYRYQPTTSGVTFRASVNPFFAFKNDVIWPLYGGISVGYRFK